MANAVAAGERGRTKQGASKPSVHEAFDDGWESLGLLEAFKTEVFEDTAQVDHRAQRQPRHLVRPLDQSLPRLRARLHLLLRAPEPLLSRAFGGARFRDQALRQVQCCELLAKELAKPGYKPETIALGANTDPYQPIERERRITRSILEVLAQTNHPVGIITKSALVARDIDILQPMAERGIAQGRGVDHHARSQRCPRHGAACRDAAQTSRDGAASEPKRAFR